MLIAYWFNLQKIGVIKLLGSLRGIILLESVILESTSGSLDNVFFKVYLHSIIRLKLNKIRRWV